MTNQKQIPNVEHSCWRLIFAVVGLASVCGNIATADDPPQLAVYTMNIDGADVRKVAQAPDRKWHAAPNWSTDGKQILFHAHLKDAATAD